MDLNVTESFETALERQLQACVSLKKALINTKKKGEANYTLRYLEDRFKLFEDTWYEIKQLNAFLQAARKADRKKEDVPYFTSNQMDRMDDIHEEGWDYFKEHIGRLTIPMTPPAASSSVLDPSPPVSGTVPVKLPKVELPTFDGDLAKWKSFESRFSSAILKNSRLTDVSRLEYLLSALKGEALAAVENLDVIDANFEIAWNRLRETYDNERIVVQALLHKLCAVKSIKHDQLDSLKQFTVHYRNTLEALRKLGHPSDQDFLVYMITSTFDSELNQKWSDHIGDTRTYPSYETLEKFMLKKAAALEAKQQSKPKPAALVQQSSLTRPRSTAHVIEESGRSPAPCLMCSELHSIRECKAFRRLSPLLRFDFLKDQRVCINCLSSDHTVSICASPNVCRECHAKHHTLLHRTENQGQSKAPSRPNRNPPSRANTVKQPTNGPSRSLLTTAATTSEVRPSSYQDTCDNVATHFAEAAPNVGKVVLLATALVTVFSPDGRSRLARALIDQGSQSSFISTNLVQSLRLKQVRSPISVTGLGGEHASTIDYSTFIRIGGAAHSKPVASTRAFLVRNISQYVPPPINVGNYRAFANLKLADPNPASNQRIELLLGAELFSQILRPGIRRSPKSGPVAQNTELGWILSGSTSGTSVSHPTVTLHHGVTEDPLEKALSRFWETEAVPASRPLTTEENLCEQHFAQSYTRDETGRFIVRLPFNRREPDDLLGDSFRGAAASLRRLTSKLQRDKKIQDEYTTFVREYESLGHMTRFSPIVVTRTFIPHRAVVREESLTTKLRVVFNASSKTTSGYSLNDLLHVGPKLQLEISKILLDWRLHQYVLVADIEKMFRQIIVHPDDRKYQCILWENESSAEIEAYELNTVTYGTACAPYLSMRVIREINHLEGANFPLASPILETSIYVDDVFMGAVDKRLLEQTRQQVCQLLARGGFHLRKWAGNDSQVLRNIPETKHSHAVDLRIFHESELKVLGVNWIPSDDAFYFNLQQFAIREGKMTKRELLSEISKLFDPLGWLSPIIIRAKILMQQQWLEKIHWEDHVSDKTQDSWNAFCSDWRALNSLRVPRWIKYGPDSTQVQLHGFSDASSAAFSCAIYARVSSLSGDTFTTLLAAKSRVAPIKTRSIPILELNGAVMLAEMMEYVTKSISVSADRIICWTDSTIVLAWLRKHPATWKTTVANRTSKIHSTLPSAIWKHVPTQFNPADLNSRGAKAEDLLSSPLWIEGPPWMREREERWPLQQVYETQEGQNKSAVHLTTSGEPWVALDQVSSWSRLIRVFGYVRRFVNRTRSRSHASRVYLTASELHEAERSIVRHVQAHAFRSEISRLKESKPLDKRSLLTPLNPFIDQFGILRVGGRLQNSFLPWETKHPRILPKHRISELILRDAHLLSLHGGTQLTVYTARQKYWILGSRDAARRIIHQCVKCARWRAEMSTQIMQNLVPSRCRPSTPFLNIGIDYAGPYLVRDAAGRGKKSHKAYIAVFVCLATRAIHLELVHEGSTAAFLAALDRFISRRGIPKTITSDNGTNFIGAARELAQDFSTITESSELQKHCGDLRIQWSFYPPGAPHHGGMQEAAVRSVKHHLRRIMGCFTPTAEEFTTLLCKVEATLNSRPITRVRDDPECLEILTPGHFLTGGPLNSRPIPSVAEEPISHLSRWQQIQNFHERLWKIWSREYLQELQSRYKWRDQKDQLSIDDVVLVETPILPPNRWEMGRIIKTFPDNAGNTRIVQVQTKTSCYRRPITRLCKLPVN
ncbi:uncharacterized protein LOC143208966 [Lasioglossum baleicum]|uniref:uncharacterized protein LOC143208966 n=1 Tax=Lasioglossum baleicum TaxID=434251 RepID=UPI003FCE7BFC